MKKVFMTIVALVIATTTFAQTSNESFQLDKSRLYYGARIGLSQAGVTDTGTKSGLTLAAVLGARVSTTVPVFLETGLGFTQRGGEEKGTTLNLNYLELPLLIKYGIHAGSGVYLMPLFGPYFSYAISGRIKNPDLDLDISAFRDDYYKHADMGFKLGCGGEWNNLYLELAYKFGVANIADKNLESVHGHAFTLEFGVNF